MDTTRYKVIFMGTPEFAAHILRDLVENQGTLYEVIGVVSQPDKPVGRKRVLAPTPVKVMAEQLQLPILQPKRIAEAYEELAQLQPDVIITAAYGQLVPSKILELPTYRCINVHGSLLPHYRGGAPIQQAIIDGCSHTGITIMYMEAQLDAGAMLWQKAIPILNTDNLETMYQKLAELGASGLQELLQPFFDHDIIPIDQSEHEVTYAYNIKREQMRLDWTQSNRMIYNHVRGLYPKPATFSVLKGQEMKIFIVEVIDEPYDVVPPGTIVKIDKKNCWIATGQGLIAMKELQLSGKKRQTISDVLNGAGKALFVEGVCFE